LRFGDAIRWIGYRVENERIQPGDEFVVTMYWQALRPIDTDYSMGIRLFGRADTPLFLLDTYPGGGMWQTTRWQPGEIIADRYRLRTENTPTTTQLLPTALQLDVGFWDFETKQFLPTFDGSGKPTGRERYEAGALVAPSTSAHGGTTSTPSQPYLSQARPAVVRVQQQGGTLTATIPWDVTADFDEDYTVFAHLFNDKGDKVAQADGRASNDWFSARWWRTGDHVEDPHTFDITSLAPGEYTLKYGLYRPTDGARMPAFDAQGQAIPDAALTQPVTIK
jgi:hypothetical protein